MALLPHSVTENYEMSLFFKECSIDIFCTFAFYSYCGALHIAISMFKTFSYFHHFQIFIFSGDLSGGQICTSFIAVARSMTKLSVTLTIDIHIVPITKLQQRFLEVQVLKFWGSIHSSSRCGTPNIYHYMEANMPLCKQ